MAENYSELMERLRKYTLPGTDMRPAVAEEAADAIEALQLKLADAQASAEASARRVVRAEAVVEAARLLDELSPIDGHNQEDVISRLMNLRDALDRLDRLAEQDSEQEKSDA